jgi:tetratricopeptide (TPR) repeat protein
VRLLLALLLLSQVARADDDARAHFKRGTTYYALGKYSEAAVEYEKAYELHPDPALLYNSAQANRLAGNKQRALTLYQNFLRLYSDKDPRGDVQRFIRDLTAAIESDRKAASIPPPKPEPKPVPAIITPIVEKKPEEKKVKPWVWGVVGAAAVVVVGVSLGVGLGVGLSGTKNPTPSLGSVTW